MCVGFLEICNEISYDISYVYKYYISKIYKNILIVDSISKFKFIIEKFNLQIFQLTVAKLF